jgi:acetyl-CoA carboxylase biotin carboxylase subunit
MSVALSEMEVAGIATNAPLHSVLMREPGFVAGGFDIHHLERLIEGGFLGVRGGDDA